MKYIIMLNNIIKILYYKYKIFTYYIVFKTISSNTFYCFYYWIDYQPCLY